MAVTSTEIEAEAVAEAPVGAGPHDLASGEAPATAPWVLSGMIVLAALAMAGTLPGRTHGLGLITEGVLADLRLERAVYAQINLVATLIGATFCWPCGWMLDRFGIRRTGAAVILLLGISTVGVAQSQSPTSLSIWITSTRGFGQSMLSVVSITLCGRASLGLRHASAMAGYSLLVSLSFIVAFRIMGAAIPAIGWRTSWWGLGWIVMIAAPLFGVLVVEPREQQGNGGSDSRRSSDSATMKQALLSPAFWIFALASSLYALVSSGLSLFNQSILSERQFDASVYYDLLAISTFAGLLGNLASGWLARRTTYNRLMAAAMALYAIALVAFPFVSNLYQVYAYGVALGVCGGIVTVVFFGVWSHAFGRVHLGKIQGLAQAATVLASAMGPLAFAECVQRFQSYTPIFWALAPCIATIAAAAWAIRTPCAATDPQTLPQG